MARQEKRIMLTKWPRLLGVSMAFMVLLLFTKSWFMTMWKYGYPHFIVWEPRPIIIVIESVLYLLALVFTGRSVYQAFLGLRERAEEETTQ